MLGKCKIQGIECTYHFNEDKIYLVPIDLDKLSELFRKINTNKLKRIELFKTYNADYCDIIYFSKVTLAISGIICEIDFYFEMYSNHEISGLRITSHELTSFVNPAEHYYLKKRTSNEFQTVDFLYDSEKIKEFTFKINSEVVFGAIHIGELLQRGIVSELKLHTKLHISFEPRKDNLFFVKICEIVKKSLQFATYSRDIAFDTVELFYEIDGQRSICGKLYIPNQHFTDEYRRIRIHSNYEYLNKYLGNLFTEVAKDSKLFVKHLPEGNQKYLNCNVIRFVNVFSAFENEYNKLPERDRLCDTSNIDSIRNELIRKMEGIKTSDNDERFFINQVIDRTKQLGKQYGMRKKIENLYLLNERSLSSSFELFSISKDDFKKKIKRLVDLRNKIVHDNYDLEIDGQIDIAIIEWITYAMFLRRIGVSEKDVEFCIAKIFECNAVEFREKTKEL